MQEEKLLIQFKQNVEQGKEQFLTARMNYFKALAMQETNQEIDEQSKKAVLKANAFYVAEENKDIAEGLKKLTGEDNRILKVSDDCLMSDKDFKRYSQLTHEERTKRGLKIQGFTDRAGEFIPSYNVSSDYKTFGLLKEAESQFIDMALSLLPDKLKEQLKGVKEHYTIKEKFLKLILKFDVEGVE